MTKRLVVIDDEPGLRLLVKMAADTAGWWVDDGPTSGSVEAALSHADVITLDLHLAEEYGLDVLRSLRAAGITAPVIILSGDDDKKVTRACLKAGATKVVLKPFDVLALLDLLDAVYEEAKATVVDLRDGDPEPVLAERPWFMSS